MFDRFFKLTSVNPDEKRRFAPKKERSDYLRPRPRSERSERECKGRRVAPPESSEICDPKRKQSRIFAVAKKKKRRKITTARSEIFQAFSANPYSTNSQSPTLVL